MDPPATGESLGTTNTARIGGIEFQSAAVNLFSAHRAETEIPRLDSTQCALDRADLLLSTPVGLLGHLLVLQRIHTGKPSKPGLVQLHGFSSLGGDLVKRLKIILHTQQFPPDLLYVGVIHCRLMPCRGTYFQMTSRINIR